MTLDTLSTLYEIRDQLNIDLIWALGYRDISGFEFTMILPSEETQQKTN